MKLQGLYECGIFSLFFPGSKIPDGFNYRSTGNLMLCILPSVPNLKIRGFNACVVYTRKPDMGLLGLDSEHFLEVGNETKGLKWIYCPVTIGLPKENEDMLWLSHWLFENGELEGGEEVLVSIPNQHYFWTKEMGIQLVYEQENKDKGVQSNSEDTTTKHDITRWSQNIVAGDASSAPAPTSKYPLTGEYFLCNHSSIVRALYSQFGTRLRGPGFLTM